MINLIVTTYNRPLHLKRMLSFFSEYYEEELNEFNIFILDSSHDKKLEFGLELLIEKLNVKYLEFDKDIFIVQKIAKVIPFNNSEYSVLLADDDIIDLKRYIEYKKFLDDNLEFSCTTGLGLYDNFEHDLFYKNLNKTVSRYSINDNEYKLRIEKYTRLQEIGNPFYGIIRTKLFNKIWLNMSTDIKFWYYPELIHNMSILIDGKFKVFNNIAGIRNLNEGLFNKDDSLHILNLKNHNKAMRTFKEINSEIDSRFIIDQLEIIKSSLSIKIKSEDKKNNGFKGLVKKLIFKFFNKKIYYDKIDIRSIHFYENVKYFYEINYLDNKEIAKSRDTYSKWM